MQSLKFSSPYSQFRVFGAIPRTPVGSHAEQTLAGKWTMVAQETKNSCSGRAAWMLTNMSGPPCRVVKVGHYVTGHLGYQGKRQDAHKNVSYANTAASERVFNYCTVNNL